MKSTAVRTSPRRPRVRQRSENPGPSVDSNAPGPQRERAGTRPPLASAAMKLSTIIGAMLLAAPATHAAPTQPPSAVEFANIFVASANAYPVAHHDARRVAKPHCVQAARARYMCAYTAVTPAGRECHLIQASWTPTAASTITVTLSGRTHRCDSLRAAIRSLP
jgi:hypothetical protein